MSFSFSSGSRPLPIKGHARAPRVTLATIMARGHGYIAISFTGGTESVYGSTWFGSVWGWDSGWDCARGISPPATGRALPRTPT